MRLFRAPSVLTRIATALERIATSVEQIARAYQAEAFERALAAQTRRREDREAKTPEGYANMAGAPFDEAEAFRGINRDRRPEGGGDLQARAPARDQMADDGSRPPASGGAS